MAENKLDKKQLGIYRKILLKIKEDIVHDIKNMSAVNSPQKDTSGDIVGHALHMADVATDMYDKEFNLGLASNDREVLHRVEVALKRIEDKTYGLCLECKKSIPQARLKAIPYTETCLKCQERLEKSS